VTAQGRLWCQWTLERPLEELTPAGNQKVVEASPAGVDADPHNEDL
jgi:hypothetical protein